MDLALRGPGLMPKPPVFQTANARPRTRRNANISDAGVINGSRRLMKGQQDSIYLILEKRIDFETNTFSIPSEKPFRVVRDLRHREENGNYVLFSPKKHMALLVTKSSFDIIRNLYKEDFTLGSLGGDDITRTIMGHLEKRGIIEEID